jgi:hypothetical protein
MVAAYRYESMGRIDNLTWGKNPIAEEKRDHGQLKDPKDAPNSLIPCLT